MLKLKAVFISSYVTFVMAASVFGLWHMVVGPRLPWLGAVLTTLPPALFFARAYVVGDVARTTARLPGLVVVAAIGFATSAGGYVAGPGTEPAALLTAVIGLTTLIVYSYWYSDLQRGENAILRMGQSLPAFARTRPASGSRSPRRRR